MGKIQTGLRLPENVRDKVAIKAEEIGLSLNDTILVMLHIGLVVSEHGYVIQVDKE